MRATSKLEQLREKTDRQLSAVIAHEIESGLGLVRGREQRGLAEEAYGAVRKLLPTVGDAGRRAQLEAKLERLREELEFAAAGKQRMRAASG